MSRSSREVRFVGSGRREPPPPLPAVEYVALVGLPPPRRGLLEQLLWEIQAPLGIPAAAEEELEAWAPRGSSRRSSPWSPRQQGAGAGGSAYRFCLDVAGFQPQEMAVKVDGRKLMVSAKHDKRSESADGCLSHEYREVRKELLLPDDANLQALTCTFNPDEGYLRLEAPRMTQPPIEERAIPITICKGPDAGSPEAPSAKEPLPSAAPEKEDVSK